MATLKPFFVLIAVCVLAACSVGNFAERQLERSLDFAGDNRAELEAVLDHYADNPEKLEAAKFLIRNMPHYYSYRSSQLDTIKSRLAAAVRQPGFNDMTAVVPPGLEHPDVSRWRRVYDSHVITAHYLIDNIDLAFEAWKSHPWNRSLGFDEFCELILPYRIGNEPLTDWRRLYASRYQRALDSLYSGSDVVEACRIVNSELEKDGCEYYSRIAMPHLDAAYLFRNRVGTCRESCDLGLYAMRACGIPVAVDCYKWSPAYQGSHQWLVVRDTTGNYIQFGFGGIVPQRGAAHGDGRKKGKVWRNSYAFQYGRAERLSSLERVPAMLDNLYQSDATACYFGHNAVTVPIYSDAPKDVFLGVFAPSGWVPLDVAAVKGDSATFCDIEPDVVYAPVAFADGVYAAVGYPFVLGGKSGVCRQITPDTTRLVPLTLKRKMPLLPLAKARLGKCVVGARIEASSDASFGSPHLIHRFDRPLDWHEVVISCHTSARYRYLRYVGPKGVPMELADFAAYADTACTKPLPLTVASRLPQACAPGKIVDGDILTAVYIPQEYGDIVFDIGHMARVGAVRFCPRTDGNFVFPGDTYELLYYAGREGWRSLGAQTAGGKTIQFVGPKGALFWLRDLTQGKEEQVFLYEGGRQVFVQDLSE